MTEIRPVAALLIDGENACPHALEEVFPKLQTRFDIQVRRLYADFSHQPLAWAKQRTIFGLLECQATTNIKGKNTVDIALAVDACDLCFNSDIKNLILVASDSDYAFLAKRLREKGVSVIGVVRPDCHASFVNACSETIQITNGQKGSSSGTPNSPKTVSPPIKTAQSKPTVASKKVMHKHIEEFCTAHHGKKGWTSIDLLEKHLNRNISPQYSNMGVKNLFEFLKKSPDKYQLLNKANVKIKSSLVSPKG